MRFLTGALVLLLLVVPALGMAGCGGGGASSTPTVGSADATSQAGAAQRPTWFPASFPLPANTSVVKDEPANGGGGTVQFHAPVALARVMQILDLNLTSHDYTVGDHSQTADTASYSIENGQFTGDLKVTADGQNSVIDITLKPKATT